LDYYDGSYVKAISHLFPEIQFDITKFAYPPSMRLSLCAKPLLIFKKTIYKTKNVITFYEEYLWADLQKRRRFFENFAKDNGFDPLVATNWYGVSQERILSAKVCKNHTIANPYAFLDCNSYA
jgi:hypothetical protein